MFFWIPASAGMTNIVKGFMTHTTRIKPEMEKYLDTRWGSPRT
jgi:hypothetical protein